MHNHQCVLENQGPCGARRSVIASVFAMIGTALIVSSLVLGQTMARSPRNQPSLTKSLRGAAAKGQFKGRVTAQGTGEPIEGVQLHILVQGVPEERSLIQLSSDKEGNFTHEVPLGHLRLDGLFPPAGYYFEDAKTYESILTTKKEPIAVKNFVLQEGIPWKIELAGYSSAKEDAPYLSWTYYRGDRRNRLEIKSTVMANAQGHAVLAIPPEGGQFYLRLAECSCPPRHEIPHVHLTMEKGFDTAHIAGPPERIAGDDGVRLKDRSGKIASLINAQFFLQNGQAVVRIPCKPLPLARAFKVVGSVQDEMGMPISQAKLTAVFLSSDSYRPSSRSHLVAHSTADGKFAMPEVLLPAESGEFGGYRMELIAAKPGYSAVETKELYLSEMQKSGIANFGVTKMKKEKILKGRVIDEAGNSLEGAVVRSYLNPWPHGHLTCRSDADGRFQFPELAYGRMGLHANYGDQVGSEEFIFNASTGELELTMRPFKMPMLYPRKD